MKEDEKGVGEMCKIMDDLRKESMILASKEIAEKLLNAGKLSHEEIVDATGLTLEDVKSLAGQAAS